MQAGLSELVPHVEVHVGEDGELPAGLDEAGAGGQHERRPVVAVPDLGVRSRLEERADEGLVAVLCRQVDRGLPAVVGEVDVGAVVEQRLAPVQSAVDGGQVQRRPSASSPAVDVVAAAAAAFVEERLE